MTSNLSHDEVTILLNKENIKDENIKITRLVDTKIEFLDVLAANNNGTLKTSVFHKPAAEPYILPYSSDHPRHIHCSTTYGSLLRAARFCSNVDEFNQERLHIELTLLLNGYPLNFISYHFKQFFKKNKAMPVLEQLDNNVYQLLHQEMIARPTRREKEKSLTHTNERNSSNVNEHTNNESNRQGIQVYYTFESGPMLAFKRELRRLWDKHYIHQSSSMNNVRLKIGTSSNKSLNHLLVKKKPTKAMLIDTTLNTETARNHTTTNNI